MTTNSAGTITPPANVPPAVWARYLRCAVAAHVAASIGEREDAQYEATHVARQVGLDEAAVEPLVLAEVAKRDELETAPNRTVAVANLKRGDTFRSGPSVAPRTVISTRPAYDGYLRTPMVVIETQHGVITHPSSAFVTLLAPPVEAMLEPQPSGILDRETPVAELSNQELWVQFMAEDRELAGYDEHPCPDDERHGALIAEITRRYGADATELTADYSVGMHCSGSDLVRWAVERFDHLEGIATGRIVPEWRVEQ